MGLFYLQISRHFLQKSMELNTHGEKRHVASTSILFAQWKSFLQVWVLNLPMPQLMLLLPKHCLCNHDDPQPIQRHSFKRRAGQHHCAVQGLGLCLHTCLEWDLKKSHCSPEWRNTLLFADRWKCFIWNWIFLNVVFQILTLNLKYSAWAVISKC